MTFHDLVVATSGCITGGYLLIGVVFFRFWVRTRERLFACFAIAFWILATERVLILSDAGHAESTTPTVYLSRLVAFMVIIWAIWDRNRRA